MKREGIACDQVNIITFDYAAHREVYDEAYVTKSDIGEVYLEGQVIIYAGRALLRSFFVHVKTWSCGSMA